MSSVTISPDVAAKAARHVSGATIAWGAGRYFDFDDPDSTTMTIEDYAYALAFTVRWRGQARSSGKRVFYGVAEHCARLAWELIRAGYPRDVCLSGLMHESDEVVLGDMPGPVKPLLPDYRALAKRCGAAIDRRFNVTCPDPDTIKRFDVRMLVTERRDLLGDHEREVWTNGGSGGVSTEGYEPFVARIDPFPHPAEAAEVFLDLYRQLGGIDVRE